MKLSKIRLSYDETVKISFNTFSGDVLVLVSSVIYPFRLFYAFFFITNIMFEIKTRIWAWYLSPSYDWHYNNNKKSLTLKCNIKTTDIRFELFYSRSSSLIYSSSSLINFADYIHSAANQLDRPNHSRYGQSNSLKHSSCHGCNLERNIECRNR